jgi:hypothetical protein
MTCQSLKLRRAAYDAPDDGIGYNRHLDCARQQKERRDMFLVTADLIIL